MEVCEYVGGVLFVVGVREEGGGYFCWLAFSFYIRNSCIHIYERVDVLTVCVWVVNITHTYIIHTYTYLNRAQIRRHHDIVIGLLICKARATEADGAVDVEEEGVDGRGETDGLFVCVWGWCVCMFGVRWSVGVSMHEAIHKYVFTIKIKNAPPHAAP
jgi:hypothetical protein